MKKRLLRMTAFLLLASMLLVAIGCANTADPADTTKPEEVVTTVPSTDSALPEETTSINAENLLGPNDFKQKTVTFYSRFYNGVWSSDLIAADENGTVLNDAIYKRNSKICSLYNVKLDQIKSEKATFRTDVAAKISVDDTSYDVLYMGLADAAFAAESGYLLDMTTIDNIDLDAQWWTQSSNDAWSIGERLYFATGDITTIDDMAIRCMYFNKEMMSTIGKPTPYELVNSNEWVYDKFFEYAKDAEKDDGDGVVTINDTFGSVAQVTFGFMMTMASGEVLCQKDADDLPVIKVLEDSARFVDVTTYLTEKISGNNSIYLGADADIMSIFTSGRSLFIAEVLLHAQTMRQNYDVNFGIIPMPKYSSEQKDYYQYTTGYCTTVVCFPTSTRDDRLDMSSFIVEAMAIESVETVTPAYYEICLKGRYADDVESMAMLDIITSSVSSDLAEIFSWGSFKNAVQDAISSGAPITSVLKSSGTVAKRLVKQTIDKFNALP